ncbi:hypothetical protein ABH905_004922 [Pseudomonas frederiksbergensis]|jgi:hypothetical protein|uniref:hypothetical protein n=1 Tax=Pseudomonas frederiksbergensis TaxID=104087 RepID=UPI003D1F9353
MAGALSAKSSQSLRFGSTLRNVHGIDHGDALRGYDHFRTQQSLSTFFYAEPEA